MAKQELSALDQALVDVIHKASSTGGEIYDAAKQVTAKAVDFAQEQIPDIIHQLLMWKLSEAIFWLVFAIILLFASVYYTKKLFEYSEGFSAFIGIVGVPISLIISCDNILNILKITIAPKIYLMEYATALLKSCGCI